jgi:DNA mismatch endonuclease (patch repair protein)
MQIEVLKMDNLTKKQRHKNMKNIKNKDTKIEIRLRKALWKKGYRYRKNYKAIPGKPDIALTKYKIAIFCDGEFFHGYEWRDQKKRLEKSNNSKYWINKISRNINRDAEVEKKLFQLGWTVMRFWGRDILNNIDKCISSIEDMIYDLTVDRLENLSEEDFEEINDGVNKKM